MPRFGRALGQAERRPGPLLDLGDQWSAEVTGAGGTTRFGRLYRGLGAGVRAVLDAARRGEKLAGPERGITVWHLDGERSADEREEPAGYRSGRC